MTWMNKYPAELCHGRVLHKRLRPVEHKFSYGVFFVRVSVSRFNEAGNRWLSINGFNLLSLKTSDYGPRDGSSLLDWAQALLVREGVSSADGEIVLQTFPRILGYVFNPISVWYCFDRGGALRAAICEVSNTFGERHNYLVAHPDQRPIEAGDWLTARKVFHVSPFCEVRGHYRFRFEQTGERAFAQIDYYDGAEHTDKLLITTIHGEPEVLTASGALGAFFRYPLMTFGVVARIHWHALRLWLKRVKFHTKPASPIAETTR